MHISIEEAASLLTHGHVVAIPTETVYGLAASITQPIAIDNIFKIKGRPSSNPLIIHIASVEQIYSYVTSTPPSFESLTKTFWPGPMTLILEVDTEVVPSNVRAGLSTAGFRIPSHPTALSVLARTGPLVMPSANLSGKPSATAALHIEEDFGPTFPLVEGFCANGVESTILIYINDRWQIIREGAIPKEAFKDALGYIPIVNTAPVNNEKPLCPGQCFRHYAPKATLTLTDKIPENASGTILGFDDRTYPQGLNLISLGSATNPQQVAENLYNKLRELDRQNVAMAWVDITFPRDTLWSTIFERLKRASE